MCKRSGKLDVLIVYLQGVLGYFVKKKNFFMYNLEISNIRRNFNFDKIYAIFGVNSFSPKVMVVSNLGHLGVFSSIYLKDV